MSNPLPLSCALLILALPGVYLLGLRLADWTACQPGMRHRLAPGAGLAAWLVAVATVARAAGSFVTDSGSEPWVWP